MGGGKGGIGKTLVSANLGIALAQAGMRVLLVDADLGGANLHTCLGVGQPSATLSDFVRSNKTRLEDIILPTGVPQLSLIAGAQDVLDAANIKYAQKQKLLRSLMTLPVDYLLLDLGAGTSFNTLDFFLVADHGVLVVLPEPTAVENAYRFVKAAFFRRLQQVEAQYGIEELVESALTTREGTLRTPHDFISQVRKEDPAAGARLEKELLSFRIRLVVNQARTDADMTVGTAVVSAWKKFFGLEMDDLGAIRYDDEAWRAIRKRRPVLLERPDSPAAQGLQRIAGRILALDGTAIPTPPSP
ncbi:CobQ/CobB/MinD/ParA nucleotide binding domain protein [Stigmatella aurantiaca DW4/3-1]|uniref:CobQ/CobB/MinD/ParA nucleotide binding domain protein n=1 Tax=Stigmatella aurantiaca (strain DW4/3-1) TaxID=378806 RepID=E3FHZ3_STIAD|nr:CobQ/CobB/MinD/ParA nucleotide binding domain protein [Stigmatella aurantiaca DW4/3-1]